MTPQKFVRTLKIAAIALLAMALLSYPLDWLVWRVSGSRMGTVTVSRFTVAELKGSKEEYYFEGSSVVDCSRSVFQEAGIGACWWVQRHAELVTRY